MRGEIWTVCVRAWACVRVHSGILSGTALTHENAVWNLT